MISISVTASKSYDILIGNGILDQLGGLTAKLCKGRRAAIISDSNVWPLYGAFVRDSLRNAGFETVLSYVMEAGEQSKNGQTFLEILEFLAENRLTRSDCIIALGGGVVGDMCGFAAACYLRGIPYIQLPTSLLACVDSSVGGKTAIDLKAGKNLAGAFYQPSLVLCDTEVLNSLPECVFRDGCAEVIKYGVLYDPELFYHLQKHGLSFDREWVIARCVTLKRDVVAQDEFDRGARQKLNLGHTFGHSVEALSNFAISHGQAVAIGMAMVSRAAVKMGFCEARVKESVESILDQFRLSTSTDFDAKSILNNALSDKKRAGDIVNLILPREIGNCTIQPVPITELNAYIEAGL